MSRDLRDNTKDGSIPIYEESTILDLVASDTDQLASYSHQFNNSKLASDLHVSDVETKYGHDEVFHQSVLPLFREFHNAFCPFYETRGATRFTFIDLFAGIGGFRYALQEQGGRCLYSSEWDRYAKMTYTANYGQVPFGDITKASTKSFIPQNFDVLTAGFPCQPFSISGKKLGFEDTRGTLIYEVFQILESHRPKVVMLENVKHLVHHDKGNTLRVIIKHLNELGYTTSWDVLNANRFGIPQNRERVIIVGSSKGKLFDFSPLKTSHEFPQPSALRLKDFLDKEVDPSLYLDEEYTLIENPTRQASGLIFVGYRNKKIRTTGVRAGTEHLSRVHKQPNRIYSAEGLHPALSAQETSGRYWIYDQGCVRKLSLSECYRIMGFPDDFSRMGPQGEQYRQIGNSVAIPMVKSIMKEILEQSLL